MIHFSGSPHLQSSPIVLDDDPDIDDLPPSKRQKLETDDSVPVTTDVAAMNCQYEAAQSQSRESTPPLFQDAAEDSPPPVFTQMNFSQRNSFSFIDEAEVPEEMIEDGLQFSHVLKDFWHNCADESQPEALNQLAKISLHDLKRFCEIVDFDSMSDDSVHLACQHLCSLSEDLSYNIVTTFLSSALCDRVKLYAGSMSRKLSETLSITSEKFPKQFIDSVFTPCLGLETIPVGHCEVFCKLVKAFPSKSIREYALHSSLSHAVQIHESNVPVFQTLVELGCDLSPSHTDMFLEKLQSSAEANAKNLKYSKLLLAFVTHYGNKLDSQKSENLRNIIDLHQTFMKKKILAALQKCRS